jgi:hypothetical protein
MPIRLSGWLVFILLVSACASQRIDTPVPTQTLNPPTVTSTATPIMPTRTPQDLPEPQDFILTPSPTPLLPIILPTTTFDIDVVEATRLDLATHIGLPPEQFGLMKVQRSLHRVDVCPTGRSPIPPPSSYGMEVVWVVDDETYTYLLWSNDDFVWCEIDRLRGEYLTAIDPIAAELSALAIRRVSQQTGVSSDAVELVDVFPVEWQDSSLGCPQDGQAYSDVMIGGYRIVVSEGETSYLFHTDSVQLVSCDFDRASN